MRQITATVLLGGSVRPTPFNSAIQRAILDLPYDQNRTLLDAWCDQIADVATVYPGTRRLLRVLTDRRGVEPQVSKGKTEITVQIDRDLSQLRGTGGVLRDIANDHNPDDYLLVANASQILLQPLAQIVESLWSLHADVAVAAHDNGAPVTLMLIRCECLKMLSDVGYVDMKEQALPLIAKQFQVKVASFAAPISYGIRTAETYLASLRALRNRPVADREPPLAEDWKSQFQLVENDARIGGNVRIHDSVVLRGAVIGQGSLLIRSLVCPGAVTAANAVFIDKIVSADGVVGAKEVVQ